MQKWAAEFYAALQWGRDQLIAEITYLLAAELLGKPGFNGAAIS